MTKQHDQKIACREALTTLERLFRRELKLSIVFAGLIGTFLTLGTIQTLDSAQAGKGHGSMTYASAK